MEQVITIAIDRVRTLAQEISHLVIRHLRTDQSQELGFTKGELYAGMRYLQVLTHTLVR